MSATSPSLSNLPSSPAGKERWPWIDAKDSIDPDGKKWPRITIVTPSYNQGHFIEETIRSVLLQGYPNLEYIVIDGGSTDNSIEVIKKYEPWLSYWVSEKDRGQSHAIAKGMAMATGEVFNWINSDDQLMPGALEQIGLLWRDQNPHLLIGRGEVIDNATQAIVHDWYPRPPRSPLDFTHAERVIMSQPSTFVNLDLVKQLGGIREDLHYVMDWELYIRMTVSLRHALRTTTTATCLSRALSHPDAKTQRASGGFRIEGRKVLKELYPSLRRNESLRLRWYERSLDIQDLVSEAMAESKQRMSQLARIPLRRPEAVMSRFYWGAVRRFIFGRGSASGIDHVIS